MVSMLVLKSMLLSRRLASKSPVKQITVPTVAAPTELVQDSPTQEETRDEPKITVPTVAAPTELAQDSPTQEETRDEPKITVPTVAAPTELVQDCPTQAQEETRDEPNPIQSFVASFVSEAASMADDVVTIISTDTNEEGGGKASAVKPATKIVKVKGGPFALTRLIKKLDKQEKEVEKIGKQLDEAEQQVMNDKQEQKVMKLEQQLSKAEERVMNTRKKMKALADKFELRDILNDIDDDEEFVERLDEVLEDGVDLFSYAGEEVVYFTQRLISTITKTANQAIFPHGVDDGDEDFDENKREE